jgi:hypothetical protein
MISKAGSGLTAKLSLYHKSRWMRWWRWQKDGKGMDYV